MCVRDFVFTNSPRKIMEQFEPGLSQTEGVDIKIWIDISFLSGIPTYTQLIVQP